MRFSLYYLFSLILFAVSARRTFEEVDNVRQLYEEFKLKYKKVYSNDDDDYRFKVFKDNLLRAKQIQSMEQGTAEYGVTKFSDLTASEFKSIYFGLKHNGLPVAQEPTVLKSVTVDQERFDWREKGAVGPVLDQGLYCGSCWAFSTVGNIEGQWFKKTGKLLRLSEQQLVDCDKLDSGCSGGYPPQTYGEVQRMGGLELDSDYPYKAEDGDCVMDSKKFKAYINDSIVLPHDEQVQKEKLKEMGPLSTALNAEYLQYYRRGILHPPASQCSPDGMNHAVLTVGYGTENGIPYWTIRNSWGTDFGEQGYFRIFRGDGTCGINLLVSSAIVK